MKLKRIAKKPKRWRAIRGEEYYTVHVECSVRRLVDIRHPIDNESYRMRNYFETISDAERYARLIMSRTGYGTILRLNRTPTAVRRWR